MKEYTEQDIKKYLANTFGFDINKIVLLECGPDPIEYCMFRVCNIVYQSCNETMNIYTYSDCYTYADQ